MKPLFRSKHLQTILGAYFPQNCQLDSVQKTVTLPDEDQIVVAITEKNDSSNTAVLIHGLGGSAESRHMRRLAKMVSEMGYNTIRINLRGVYPAKKTYSASASDDIYHVLEWIKSTYHPTFLTLIGFSLGGNIALKLAGEHRDAVDQVLAVSMPLDLYDSVKKIAYYRHFFYHKYYLKKICRQAKAHISLTPKSLYEFDDQITAPFWGYKNAKEYYLKASCKNFIPKIEADCHLLLAKDDPFVDGTFLQENEFSKNIDIHLTRYGGHMGFLQKGKNPFFIDDWVRKKIRH